jgi:hypothetical protein
MAPTAARSDANDRENIAYNSPESRQDSLRRMAGQSNISEGDGGVGEDGDQAGHGGADDGLQETAMTTTVHDEYRRRFGIGKLLPSFRLANMVGMMASGLFRHALRTLGWLFAFCLHRHTTNQPANPHSAPAATTIRKRRRRTSELTIDLEVERRAEISSAYHATSPRSPDTASPIYPERAIRPLPKSRLKSKLSPGQAETLVFPPEPPPVSPTLNFSLSMQAHEQEEARLMTNGEPRYPYDYENVQRRHHQHQPHSSHCTCGEDGDSGEDEVEFDHPDYRYSTPPAVNGAAVKPVDSLQRRLVEASRSSSKPPPPGSTASSADGYESFENTSNKKKRKIPLSGTSSMHQSQLSAEMASMGISSGQADGAADEVAQQQYSPSGNGTSPGSGTGISGAGRGRYGRQDGRHRRPLGSSTMNVINGYTSRAPARDVKHGEGELSYSNEVYDEGSKADVKQTVLGIENTGGIISQAIKTAAEQGPLTPAKGRDNVSLLQSATAASATPKTQFTFTCESDSATKMVDQQAAYAAGTPTPQRSLPPGAKGAGTQTTPPLRGGAHPNNVRNPPPPPSNHAPAGEHPQAPPPKPKPRRNPAKEYALQAANRKKNQQYQNYHHRPKPEDLWVCEFCEYEDIYGAPPYAMIRKYEIKDRQERKKAEEKRRLLEKAKMKGRKNKKGAGKGKNNNANNAAAPAPPAHPQSYDPNLPPPDDEEYYDDEDYAEDDYADDQYRPDDQYQQEYYPPPAPASTPATVAAGGGARPQHV